MDVLTLWPEYAQIWNQWWNLSIDTYALSYSCLQLQYSAVPSITEATICHLHGVLNMLTGVYVVMGRWVKVFILLLDDISVVFITALLSCCGTRACVDLDLLCCICVLKACSGILLFQCRWEWSRWRWSKMWWMTYDVPIARGGSVHWHWVFALNRSVFQCS